MLDEDETRALGGTSGPLLPQPATVVSTATTAAKITVRVSLDFMIDPSKFLFDSSKCLILPNLMRSLT